MAEIYLITSPSGKMYVGQCVKVLANGKKHGYMARWKLHVRDALKNKNYCRALCSAIRKYGPDNFKIKKVMSCLEKDVNFFEQLNIMYYDTLTPNGYNLTTGGSNGRQSQETSLKKSISLKGKNKGRIMNKRIRKNPEDNNLPKYVRRYTDSSGKEGYRIMHHPKGPSKSFLSKYKTMNEKFKDCINHLKYLNSL
jgi:hypothetical protein